MFQLAYKKGACRYNTNYAEAPIPELREPVLILRSRRLRALSRPGGFGKGGVRVEVVSEYVLSSGPKDREHSVDPEDLEREECKWK